MRWWIHPICDEHKEAQILVLQNCFGFRSTYADARDFVFDGWSKNIQRDYAGFKWQSQEFVVAGRVIDFREIVWRVRKRGLWNAESRCSKGSQVKHQAKHQAKGGSYSLHCGFAQKSGIG